MRTAVEWNAIERVPCSMKTLRTPRTESSFYEVDQIRAACRRVGPRAASAPGGTVGRRSGSAARRMIALEWTDVPGAY